MGESWVSHGRVMGESWAVPRSKQVDRALTVPATGHPVDQHLLRPLGRALDGAAVVVRAP